MSRRSQHLIGASFAAVIGALRLARRPLRVGKGDLRQHEQVSWAPLLDWLSSTQMTEVTDTLATVLEGSKGALSNWGCLVADERNPPWRSLWWILGTTPEFSSKLRLCQGGRDSNLDFRARLHPSFFHPNFSPQHAILHVQERAQLLTSSRKLLVSCSRSLCPLSSPAWTVSLPPISLPRRHFPPSSRTQSSL
jgi:hypothetical protein